MKKNKQHKKALLYASPFPPMKSGISDYSVILVKALSEWFDITLYTGNYGISEESMLSFPVIKHGIDRIDFQQFDYYLYNMGNNALYHDFIYEAALEHPGVVILHDIVLFHFVFEYYKTGKNSLYNNLYRKFGINDFIALKEAIKDETIGLELASKLPLNTELLKTENRFIVHSEYSRNRILDTGLLEGSHIKHINMIQQINQDDKLTEKNDLLSKYHIDSDAFLICSFGYIQETKLNREAIHAVERVARTIDRKICFVLVGEGNYVDSELKRGKIIKTGYADLEAFNSFITYADLIINLRYPPMGETSAAMMRSLQAGKAVITNNGGWFSEIPDSCVKKVELANVEKNLESVIRELVNNKQERVRLGECAMEYMRNEYDTKTIGQSIYRFICEVEK